MAKFYTELDNKLQEFIAGQKIFFVGTAASEGRVNVSPKGMDSLKVLNSNQLIWLNLTGSGNETTAHLLEQPRMTLMFCAFEGKPWILRVYGKARAIHPRDDEWENWIKLFPEYPGSRQIFLLDVESAQTSCGFAVPNYQYKQDREDLVQWTEKIGDEGVKKYWKKNNQTSIDGKPTKIFND
ncbi:MAG: pyridoxamine 5'-phosphate oxidase family protein [Nitrospina sp.]|nr:pyridoxamine 5'-phosphate oxidase family protein [Nitrospina sp.]MBT3509101.1 pyridoxamine 5'-phosphate oxidase family protein [Nitrospina sp.]MBT3876717.1 pyridoxamine 5'-phosphate oxidase family protein [Nitrospina sp.]MBT4047844.1 pyridoxamine 5'-phosphate oxidase family protein [Nitrospina sp.]MBT4558595.1 pyridoxamine 5'-phosphate oxidase family protein [Nitrospina sp.]